MIARYASVCSIPYDRNLRSLLRLALDNIIFYDSFLVLTTAITIINYGHTVIMIVNYNCKTFIVQVTGVDPIKKIRSKFTYSFSKQGYQRAMENYISNH
jgi:hypothetical protein